MSRETEKKEEEGEIEREGRERGARRKYCREESEEIRRGGGRSPKISGAYVYKGCCSHFALLHVWPFPTPIAASAAPEGTHMGE